MFHHFVKYFSRSATYTSSGTQLVVHVIEIAGNGSESVTDYYHFLKTACKILFFIKVHFLTVVTP